MKFKKKQSVRLLSLILSLLLMLTAIPLTGIASVSANSLGAGLYLRGNMNGWNCYDEYKFVDQGNGIYTLVLDMTGGNYEFKIATPNWSTSIGNPKNDDDNAILVIEADSIIKFTADTKTRDYTAESMNTKSDFNLGNSPITIEAEKYTYALGAVNVWGDSNASAGKYVGAFDKGDSLHYGVYVNGTEPKAYRFTVDVASDKITENGVVISENKTGKYDFTVGDDTTPAFFVSKGGWQVYNSMVFTKVLQPGYNRISIYNTNGTYNVDKIKAEPVSSYAENIGSAAPTAIDLNGYDSISSTDSVSSNIYRTVNKGDYVSYFVNPQVSGVYRVTFNDPATSVFMVGTQRDGYKEIKKGQESATLVIDGITEVKVLVSGERAAYITDITFEYTKNIEQMGYAIDDEKSGAIGYRFENTFNISEIVITNNSSAAVGGTLCFGNGKSIEVNSVPAKGSKAVNLGAGENVAWFVFKPYKDAELTLKAVGVKDESSPDDIGLKGYWSSAEGWVNAAQVPYCATVAELGKIGFGFDKEATVSKIVVVSDDASIPTKATLTTADGKVTELSGAADKGNLTFSVDNLYSFGFYLDFGEEMSFNAIRVYGDTRYNGGITDIGGKQDYTLYVNGITEDDSRVVANTGTHILTSETGSDRQWKYDPSTVGDAPSFKAPNTPLAEAVYNLTMEEVFKSINYDEAYGDVFYTGTNWHKVWTRDTAISMQYILSWLFPDISTNCAKAKVVGKDGNLTFEEDTGTGGSYPVSTDRIIMMLAVWETYLADGNKETLEYFYNVAANTINQDYEVIYDSESGLFRGETCGLDHRDKTYGDWTGEDDENGIVTIAEGKAASTNIIFCQVMKLLSKSATILGKGEKESKAWSDLASTLEAAIETRLWHEDLGTYASWEYPDWMGSPLSYKQDVLADGYAVWYNIGGQAKADSIMSNHTLVNFGANTVYPQKDAQRWTDYKYHDSGVWPGWEAILMIGAVNNENENNLLAEEIWNSCLRGAAACLTNYEVIDYETGEGLHSTQQLWSVAGTMAGYYRVLFGLEYTTEGITFDPYVPQWMEGPFYISNLKYRNATLNLELQGKGDTVKEMYVNGKAVNADYVFPADASGSYEIKILLADSGEKDTVNLKDENTAKAPTAPTVTLNGTTLKWNTVSGYSYKVWTGKEYADAENGTYTVSSDTYGCYSVIAVDKATGLWSELSKPIVYNPKGSIITANVGNAKNSCEFTVKVPVDGEYQLSAIHTNQGDPTAGITAAIRSVYVDGKDVGTLTFPAMSFTHQLSSHLRLSLTAGEHTVKVLYDTANWYDRNMSNAHGEGANNVTLHNFKFELVDGSFSDIVAPDTKTVFFTDNKGWGHANIFFWGGSDSTQWPGEAMEYAYTNENGEKVYKYTLDESTPNVVFNSGNGGEQTVDITSGVEDYTGFYLTGKSGAKWNVGTFEVVKPTEPTKPTEPAETSTAATEPTMPTETVEPSTAITEPAQTTAALPTEATVPTASQEVPSSTDATENTTIPQKAYLIGDTDLNGKVNVKDATLIQKHAAYIVTLLGDALITADVNGDEKINVKDATVVQKYLARMKVDFPVNEFVTK